MSAQVSLTVARFCLRLAASIRRAAEQSPKTIQKRKNTTVLSAILRPYQGAISADEGHIAVHETGAIEATGHKVLTLPCANGKITAAQIDTCVEAHYTSGIRPARYGSE